MIYKRLKEHYEYVENRGYEIFGLYLQGSQNYGLETTNSDIDTKCIIIPTLDDIVSNKELVSETLVIPNNEHIDVKDIRIMFNTFTKQNINFLEILFTDFFIINPKYKDLNDILISYNERIAHIDFNRAINCMAGMSKEKYKALKHQYPAIIDKIEKYGYDTKQLHHIARMNFFIKKYANNTPYKKCLLEEKETRDYLISLKTIPMALEKAEDLAKKYDVDTYDYSKQCIKAQNVVDKGMINILLDIQKQAIVRKIKGEIENEQI